ncbi:MAG: carbohydrate ABC transporter permease [Kineosporiaceae bacterium]
MRTPARRSPRHRRDAVAAAAFLSPWLLGLVAFSLGPMAASLVLSFTDYELFGTPGWVGWDNYRRLLAEDPRYLASLGVTVTFVVTSVPLQLAVALGVAMLLRGGLAGVGLYRAVYYLPSLLGGSVAVAILWRQVFGREGVVNALLEPFGVPATNWIGDPSTALATLVLLAVWQFGAPMVIFLAGLNSIPGELYEAATVDGAGPLRRFRDITLPMLSPVILFNGILQMIGAFQVFTPAFIISGGSGGPTDSTLFYTLYLYQRAFTAFDMGYASAMAWVLLLVIAASTVLVFRMSAGRVFYAEER